MVVLRSPIFAKLRPIYRGLTWLFHFLSCVLGNFDIGICHLLDHHCPMSPLIIVMPTAHRLTERFKFCQKGSLLQDIQVAELEVGLDSVVNTG